MISGLKRILADVKAKRVTKGTNGVQLIVNGWGLIKQGLSLIRSDVRRRHKK